MAGVTADRTGAVLRELLSPAGIADPYAVYRWLHADAAAGRDLGRLVIGHADAITVLADRTLSSDRITTTLKPLTDGARLSLDPLEPTLRAIFAFQDPPAHTRVRRLLQASFTPTVVRRQRDAITAIASRLIGRFGDQPRRSGDLVANVTFPLPALVIGALLGIDDDDLSHFQQWALQLVRFFGTGRPDAALAAETQATVIAMRDFMTDLVSRRRVDPGEDLLSAMIAARDDEGMLTEDELFANALFLMTAGHETAANQLANGVRALLDHPEQRALLRAEPERLDSAVEEILRFDSAVQMTARTVTDSRPMVGRRWRPGDAAVVLLGAANRDPNRFAEPDRFDIRRDANAPLSFAHGAHHCLGAALAREELRVVIPMLFDRLPDLTLTEPVECQPTLDFRGPTRLQVRW
jgi:pimeloyl-[acyl-carrier protein] synthase